MLRSRSVRFANRVITFVFIYLVLFSIAQYISFLITGVEQTYLIESTFTVFGVELGGLLCKRVCDKIFGKRKKNTDDEEAESAG